MTGEDPHVEAGRHAFCSSATLMAGIISIGWHLPAERQSVEEVAIRHRVSPRGLREFGLRSAVLPQPDDHPSTLAAAAARAALDAAGLAPTQIDLLIFAGSTRDQPAPWVAAFAVLHRLGATRAAGFDLSSRCPGLADALWVAAQLIRAGSIRNAVVCCGDRFDHLIAPSAAEPSLANAVFSAGGAAAVSAVRPKTTSSPARTPRERISRSMPTTPRGPAAAAGRSTRARWPKVPISFRIV